MNAAEVVSGHAVAVATAYRHATGVLDAANHVVRVTHDGRDVLLRLRGGDCFAVLTVDRDRVEVYLPESWRTFGFSDLVAAVEHGCR